MNVNSARKILLPLLIIVCSASIGFTQQLSKEPAQNNIRNGCAQPAITVTAVPRAGNSALTEDPQEHPYGGTFQFISKKGEPQEFFTKEILKFVEDNRLEDEDRIIDYTSRTRIRIPSKKTIKKRNFRPYTTLYSFE